MDDHAVVSFVHGGTVRAEFCGSLLALAVAAKTPIDTLIVFSSGPNISQARNQVVDKFLRQTTAAWLLMTDTDMVFTADALDRLMDAADPAKRPIVGGLCYQLTDGASAPVLFQIDETQQPMRFRRQTEWADGEVIRVAATGAAFLLAHRDALEQVAATAGQPGAPWFRETPGADWLRIIGEDTSFFLTCGLAGIPVHVHTGVRIGHMKSAMVGDVG